jgi:diguanylate cyclase (GGDEF)-like protein
VLALVLATLALVIATVVVVIGVRSRKATDIVLQRGLNEMRGQIERLADELTRAVTEAQENATRARILESLGQAVDPDEVLARCVEAALSLPRVSAAVVHVEVDGSQHSAAAGLEPTATYPVTGPPDGEDVRAIGFSYHYSEGRGPDAGLRAAVAVPIELAGRQIGFLTVFGRSEEPPVAETEFRTLEAIAGQTGPAIERARRRTTVLRRLDNDSLTGLGNRQVFHETLALEVARAHRQGQELAVCVLDVDDFRTTTALLSQTAGDELLVELTDAIVGSIRPTDIACRIGGDEFAVILPRSTRIDAEGLFARVQARLRRRPLSPGPVLSVSGGIAELERDDDGVSLHHRAEEALRSAKDAGKGIAAQGQGRP